jgi:hypothetical protein
MRLTFADANGPRPTGDGLRATGYGLRSEKKPPLDYVDRDPSPGLRPTSPKNGRGADRYCSCSTSLSLDGRGLG